MFLSRSDMARISGGATSCSFGSGHQWRRRCAPPLLAQPTALRPRPPTATAERLSSPVTTAMGWRRGRRHSLNRMEARARRWTSLKRMEARALTFSEADGGGVGARRECRTDLRAGHGCKSGVSERLEAVHRISKTWTRGSADFGESVDPHFSGNLLLSWTVPFILATTKHCQHVDDPFPSHLLSPTRRTLKCAECMVRMGAYCCCATCRVSESSWMYICTTEFEFCTFISVINVKVTICFRFFAHIGKVGICQHFLHYVKKSIALLV
jgi:hypothetical protein